MNKRTINKAAVYFLKAIKKFNMIQPPPIPAPIIINLLIDKAIKHLENKQI
jgi:hypothetical protein